MKIVSFNINGLRARPHQLAALIERHQPDVIGLQETKVADDQFPQAEIEALGYHVHYHGQKGHYGVALLSRQAPLELHRGFPSDGEESQRRFIWGTFSDAQGNPITVMNGYFPQGENREHPTVPGQAALLRRSPVAAGEQLQARAGPGGDGRHQYLAGGLRHRHWRGKPQALAEDRQVQLPAGRARMAGYLEELGPGRQLPGPESGGERPLQLVRLPQPWLRGHPQARPAHRCDPGQPGAAVALQDAGIDYDLRGMEKPSDHAPIWLELA